MRRALALALAGLLAAATAAADVQVQARMSRSVLTLGETATLEVVVRGASGEISDPAFDVPTGLEILSGGRSTSFTWINGRSSAETVFRFEVAPLAAGRYALGPIRVRVGREVYSSGTLAVSVSAAASQVGPSGSGPASLRVDVDPAQPWVGQPVRLRVRLVQRVPLAEDPQYTPPATPGFWSESPSPPESYYAALGNERVLVTETRSRLYPLAPGTATIGEATALLALAVQGSDDPSQWVGGRVPRREVVVHSAPVRVTVRALPAGAPAAFDGAVGTYGAVWSADRERTSRDVPLVVRLDLRGQGNLPLVHAPALAFPGAEVFPGGVEDSLGPPGSPGPGRRRFQWTVLARSEGELRLAAPAFAWFDPAAGRYRTLDAPAIAVEVGPPLHGDQAPAAFPGVFSDHPVDPLARPALPWAWALAGLALGGAVALWRAARRRPAAVVEDARQREWLRAVGMGHGPDFWRAADESSAWLESRGEPLRGLRREISAARFSGAGRDEDAIRRRLVEALSRALPAPASRRAARGAAVLLGLAALALAALFAPRGGEPAARERAARADAWARAGDVGRASQEWRHLWQEGAHAPGLAARLAWSEARLGRVGPATAWVLRGHRGEPRDAALGWASERVREAGGLVGASAGRLPVRSVEWGLLALLSGTLAGFARRKWPLAAALAILAVLAAAVGPIELTVMERAREAVVREPVALEGMDVSLEPGQVVRVLEARGARLRVEAGRGAVGLVEGGSLERVEEVPG